jgi:hypothetical protein
MPWVTPSSDARGAVGILLSAAHQTWFPTWVYRLDPAFRVRDADYFSQYGTVHDFYASAGRLTHRFDPRREGPQLRPVLRWNGSGYDRVERPER